jgi:hypothetical protein
MTPADFPTVVPTIYWHQLDDGRVQCDLCPRSCRLHEGQRSFCFVRARHHEQIVLTTYGHSSGFCVDPIEKNHCITFCPGRPSCRLARRDTRVTTARRAREKRSGGNAAAPASGLLPHVAPAHEALAI